MVNFSIVSALVAGVALFSGQAVGKVENVERGQNGNSVLGTRDMPNLPKFRRDNPLPNGFPWSRRTVKHNYYENTPNTGVVRNYEFTVTREIIAPDGYERESLLINGEFPGPMIEANWGDQIHITVHNNITGPEEGFALHTHGLLHRNKPWEDGVPAVSQCPIAPGTTHTYKVTADMYGSSWYHSHYSTQYAGGVFGPMIIHGPISEDYDVDVGPVMLSDHYHAKYQDVVKPLLVPNLTAGGVLSDNNLINGKMTFNCSNLLPNHKGACHDDAEMAKFKFQKGKKHLLRLINASGEGIQRFSIDEHNLTVIANDFIPIHPYDTQVVTLAVGQRADVIVEANGDLDSYWMRSNISTKCSASLAGNATAIIYYDDAETTPESQPWEIPETGLCMNDPIEINAPIMEVPVPEPDLVIEMNMTWFLDEEFKIQFTTNNVSYRGAMNEPTLFSANHANYSKFTHENNLQITNDAQNVRVILYNSIPEAHPMHLHGFNSYILDEGLPGAGLHPWNGTVKRPSNPLRRDTFMIAPLGYTVFQFDAGSNPGVWPFHCHTAVHAATGMFTQFLTMPGKVAEYDIPATIADTCRKWEEWSHLNDIEQVESG